MGPSLFAARNMKTTLWFGSPGRSKRSSRLDWILKHGPCADFSLQPPGFSTQMSQEVSKWLVNE